MADIKQAGDWMNRGMRVKRYVWGTGTYLRLAADSFTLLCIPSADERPHPYQVSIIDLISDDWEVAA